MYWINSDKTQSLKFENQNVSTYKSEAEINKFKRVQSRILDTTITLKETYTMRS